MSMTDTELLQRYVRDHSESAFAELVQRHLNLVYAAALRQVNGDVHLAEDVTQSVFADFARKAAKLTRHTSLAGWLYTSTRFIAANQRRTEQRRTQRETEAHTMNSLLAQPEPSPDWLQLSPLVDDAMHELNEAEREAVLLRHFQNFSYGEIGGKIGLTENAARMRVERALEKLREILGRRGLALPAVALAGLLAANAVTAAPTLLAARVVAGALAGAAAVGSGSALGWLATLLKSKAALGGTAAVLALVLGVLIVTRGGAQTQKVSPIKNVEALAASAAPVVAVAPTNSSDSATNQPTTAKPAKKKDSQLLHLKIVAADSGKPIPMVPIDYRGWTGKKFKGKSFTSDRFGECEVDYPTNMTELELTTRKDGIADTRLLWRPPNGEIIPTNYLLRVDWPVAISGIVEDADGKPVVGAKVGWNHQENPATSKPPQSHEFGWIETTTDAAGKWRINRMAEDMVATIYGGAKHPDYAESQFVFCDRNKQALQQLRDGTHVFKMGRAMSVSGVVVDAADNPVSGAKVFVCPVMDSGKRETKSAADGTFSVKSSRSGEQLVTADAKGFAPTTIKVNITANTEPVKLVVKPGKTLRILVTDIYGTPIPGATLWYDCINFRLNKKDEIFVQLDFSKSTDKLGRIVHENAPDCEMRFTARAAGFHNTQDIFIRPDDQEHRITLENALVVHGEVRDADTHQLIPKFRIAQGWPDWNPVDNTTNAQWSTIDRFWSSFSSGVYSNTLEEAVVGGTKNRGYFLKFIAEGYQSFVSRLIGANEGNVELNIALHPAQTAKVVVYAPSGRRALNDDVGFVSPRSHLALVPGGFKTDQVQSGGSLVHLDKNGTFELDNDPQVTRVVVAGDDGFAEATPAELAANPQMQLQPWGRLEATIYSGGQPVSGREYMPRFSGGSDESINFDLINTRFTSDANGKLIIEKLPPGKHQLMRLIHFDAPDGQSGGWQHGNKSDFEIRPGETTKLELGISNCTITAHLQWPAGMAALPKQNIFAELHTPMPEIPREMMTNQAASMEFMQSDAFQAAMKHHRSFPAKVSAEGIITVEDVEPGEYQLSVGVMSGEISSRPPPEGKAPDIHPIAYATKDVSLTGASGNLSDIGTIELKATPQTP